MKPFGKAPKGFCVTKPGFHGILPLEGMSPGQQQRPGVPGICYTTTSNISAKSFPCFKSLSNGRKKVFQADSRMRIVPGIPAHIRGCPDARKHLGTHNTTTSQKRTSLAPNSSPKRTKSLSGRQQNQARSWYPCPHPKVPRHQEAPGHMLHHNIAHLNKELSSSQIPL